MTIWFVEIIVSQNFAHVLDSARMHSTGVQHINVASSKTLSWRRCQTRQNIVPAILSVIQESSSGNSLWKPPRCNNDHSSESIL